jgi:hypothetical protein
MARINDSAIRFWQRRSGLTALLSASLSFVSGVAGAESVVAVRSARAELEPLTSRLTSELAGDGYATRLEAFDGALICGADDSVEQTAWVSLALDAERGNSVVATVCYRGTMLLIRGSRSEPARFAVTVAEALNGLRSGPLLVGARGDATSPSSVRARLDAASKTRVDSFGERAAFEIAETLLVDPKGFPLLWGGSLAADWRATAHVGLVCDAFITVSRARFSSAEVDVRGRTSFVRLGPALWQNVGPFALKAAIVAGPALTWSNVHAVAPRAGGTAAAPSAIGSLGVELTYPAQGRLFAAAHGRVSLLLPAIRFAVPPDSAHTLGPALFETSIGIGVHL